MHRQVHITESEQFPERSPAAGVAPEPIRVDPPLARDHAEYVRKHPRVERTVVHPAQKHRSPAAGVAPEPISPTLKNPPMEDLAQKVDLPLARDHAEYVLREHSRAERRVHFIRRHSSNARQLSATGSSNVRGESTVESPTELELNLADRLAMVSMVAEYQDMFIGGRRCRNCDHRIKSPDKTVMLFPTRCITAQPIIVMLHLTCSACGTVYCRGCYRATRCPTTCLGEYPCPILNPCCHSIPALASFEILSAFDSCYLADPALTKPATYSNRALFHDYVMAEGTSKEVKISEITSLEKAFVRTMENLRRCLPRIRHDGKSHLHPVIIHLFASSFFMEVLKRFLERDDEWYWIFHHKTYVSIVNFLATVIECGLTTFISSPFPQIYESWGLREHVWGRNTIVWEREKSGGAGAGMGMEIGTERVTESKALNDSGLVDKLKKKRDEFVERKAQTRLPGWVNRLELIVDGLNFFLASVIVS